MPTDNTQEGVEVDSWPVVELSRRAAGYPLYLEANSLPGDEFKTYYPVDHPGFLSPDEARLVAEVLTEHRESAPINCDRAFDYSGTCICRFERSLSDRLSTYAEEN
jgi:hypothetical protein